MVFKEISPIYRLTIPTPCVSISRLRNNEKDPYEDGNF